MTPLHASPLLLDTRACPGWFAQVWGTGCCHSAAYPCKWHANTLVEWVFLPRGAATQTYPAPSSLPPHGPTFPHTKGARHCQLVREHTNSLGTNGPSMLRGNAHMHAASSLLTWGKVFRRHKTPVRTRHKPQALTPTSTMCMCAYSDANYSSRYQAARKSWVPQFV